MNAAIDILKHGFMITGFVLIMMLLIEYLNVLTRGNWDRIIARLKWGQVALCSFLGFTPGCLGAYAVASLYIHRIVTIGALTAAMIATCGDEAFVMLALFPGTAMRIFLSLFIGGLVSGILIDLATKSRLTRDTKSSTNFKSSHPELLECIPFCKEHLIQQWKNCTPHRGLLTFFLGVFLVGVLSGTIEHQHDHTVPAPTAEELQGEHMGHHDTMYANHDVWGTPKSWDWVKTTLLALGLVALAIVATVPDHFLDEHLWHHLVKEHFWRVLLWTMGALLTTEIVIHTLDIHALVESHSLPILITACLIGLLPASGPHLVFVTLYAQDAIPLSILMANCIVQDGHGMIPTLAHSRRAFIVVKLLKLAIGVAVGLLGHTMNW